MKLKQLQFILFLLIALDSNSQKVTKNYISKFLPLAKELKSEWGIPVSIILGVSILESGSGTSLNARELNNYFGVKGKNHLKHRKTKYKQYTTPQNSFKGFCSMISRKSFYKKLKNNMNYSAWLIAMNHANYAGAKGVWVSRIKAIIRRHNINSYDQ